MLNTWASRKITPAPFRADSSSPGLAPLLLRPQKAKQLLTEAVTERVQRRSDPHRHRVHVDRRGSGITCRPRDSPHREPHGRVAFRQGAPGKEAQELSRGDAASGKRRDADRGGSILRGLVPRTAATLTSTGSFASRRPRWIARARGDPAQDPSSSCTSVYVRALFAPQAVTARASPSPASGSSPRTPSQLRTRTRSSRPNDGNARPSSRWKTSRPTSSPAAESPGLLSGGVLFVALFRLDAFVAPGSERAPGSRNEDPTSAR